MCTVWKNSKQDGDPVTTMKITCDVNEIRSRNFSNRENEQEIFC